MRSCTASCVCVSQQSTCLCRGKVSRRDRNENAVGRSSPGARAITERSTVPARTRGGVPVFIRPRRSPHARRASDRDRAGGSFQRPASRWASRAWMRPRRNVPVVTTAARHASVEPSSRIRPASRPPRTLNPAAVPSATARFGAASRIRAISAAAYRTWADGQRSPRTAVPREPFSTLNWIAVRSATSPIAPPSASISRTTCPFARPPTAGLQLMRPIVARSRVRRSVFFPRRAEASAASQPAWPPPTTTTSHRASIPATLLAHAERREDPVQELLGGRLARDRPQRRERLAHVHRDELRRAAGAACKLPRLAQGRRPGRQGLAVPFEDEQLAVRLDETEAPGAKRAQRFEPQARARRNENLDAAFPALFRVSAREIRFRAHDQDRVRPSLSQKFLILLVPSQNKIDRVQDEVRRFPRPLRDSDADSLDLVLRRMEPRRVEERHRLAANLAPLRALVARRTGHGRDNGAIAPDEGIEERRLPRVRPPEDRDHLAPVSRAAP